MSLVGLRGGLDSSSSSGARSRAATSTTAAKGTVGLVVDIPADGAFIGVLSSIGRLSFGHNLRGELLADLLGVAAGVPRSVGILVPSIATSPGRSSPARAHTAST